ncbi:MAG: hypothetical protein CSA70_03725 [Rhodobacterales bacterium]|nr:MAG: hypothetical protein CSA70_03725 [Rhodobacterales bacterium]
MTHIQRKFNAFVEGYSTHLEVEGVTVPNVQDHVEELKSGGLGGAVDVPLGIQKMEAGIKINSRQKNIMKHVGLAPGVHRKITFRSVNVSEIDGGQEDEVISITGRLNANNGGWEAQNVPKDDYKIGTIFFYKHTISGEVVHHIDLKNHICIVDGVDHWADHRSGLGF